MVKSISLDCLEALKVVKMEKSDGNLEEGNSCAVGMLATVRSRMVKATSEVVPPPSMPSRLAQSPSVTSTPLGLE